MRSYRFIPNLIFASNNLAVLRDYKFWLLLIGLNTGANLGFEYLFPHQKVLIGLFLILIAVFCLNNNRKYLHNKYGLFVLSFVVILVVQSLYLLFFSISTSIHYILLISVAVMLVALCGKKFPRYFSSIIFVYAVISLICFSILFWGGSIPFYEIDNTNIDGGTIMRVYNFYYTQLGNPMNGLTYDLRNCGPFWEPGAFQGFLNLSLWFEITLYQKRNIYWKFRVATLVLTVLTTLSTGGYVVLFVLLLYYFSHNHSLHWIFKFLLSFSFIILSCFMYYYLDFLGEKIETGGGRLDFSFQEFPNIMYALCGYGYATESFKLSSMSSASSVYNLLRYVGIFGFGSYMIPLFLNQVYHRIWYFVIITLILMNEPFLSNSLIWWAMPFVVYDSIKNSNNHGRYENLYNTYYTQR